MDDEDGAACVRVREGGEVTDRIELDRACFASALGGPDGRTLFMTVAVFPGVERMAEMFAARTGEVRTAAVAVPGIG
ncbi:hypothetical protein [Nonomuraea sp. NPDC052265]|uniref:hypothetical protein n=1 Tax=Nonomuraea sp. NPDC052265 TaxID=3364374 RepID=UPI0037C86E0F